MTNGSRSPILSGMGRTLPQTPVELLQRMVRFDSVNGALTARERTEAELADWLESVAGQWGLHTRKLPVRGQADQLLVCHEAGAGRPWLLFDSHLDTVSVEGMTIDPFAAELRNGRVYGRGAGDTKGTGAAMLWALRSYLTSDRRPNNIALLFSIDEEVGMSGIQSFVNEHYPNLGFEVSSVIVGEPTELRPVVAHNGVVRWKLITRGVAAHSAVPHEGRSAISAMLSVLEVLETKYIPNLAAEHPLTGRAVCSVNRIHGGIAPNIIPDRCEVEIDRRIVPGEDAAAVLPAVAKLLEPLRAADPDLLFEQQFQIAHPPLTTEPDAPLLQIVKATLKQAGLPVIWLGVPFATNGGYLHAAGLPTIVLGPGEPATAHTKDEWVSVEQIERGVALYLALMQYSQE